MKRQILASAGPLVATLAVWLLLACGTDDAAPAPDPVTDAGSDQQAVDAAPPVASTCETTRAYQTACNGLAPDGGEELTCGDAKFDMWCAANDQAINSAAYRRAEAACLTTANCDGLARRNCEYATYATAVPTAAQAQLVAAYCRTCEPADPDGCATRKTTYDPALGPRSVDDVFVAAWELSDPLDDLIRVACTGTATDAGTCLAAFAKCSGGVYVDRLPDCPK